MFIMLVRLFEKNAIKKPSVIQNLSGSVRTLGMEKNIKKQKNTLQIEIIVI